MSGSSARLVVTRGRGVRSLVVEVTKRSREEVEALVVHGLNLQSASSAYYLRRIVDLIEAAACHHRALLWRSVQVVRIAESDSGHRVEPLTELTEFLFVCACRRGR